MNFVNIKMLSPRAPTTFVLASSCPLSFPTSHLPSRLRHDCMIQLQEDIAFPNLHLKQGTLLSLELPLENSHAPLVLFRTHLGSYALGCRMSQQFFETWEPTAPWVVLPLEGLDITGVIQKIRTP